MRNDTQINSPIAYSVGLVLAWYLIIVLPTWGVSVLWNRMVPSRVINPWILPSLAWLLLAFCVVIVYCTGRADIDDPMMIAALLPAALGCPYAAWRWRRPEIEGEETLGIHRD